MSDNIKNAPSEQAKAVAPVSEAKSRRPGRQKAQDGKKPLPDANGGKSEKRVTAPKKAPAKKKAAPKVKRANTSSQRQARGKKPDDLPEKRLLFAKFYLTNGFNATQAAISAGYSEKTAGSMGSQLLTFIEVQNHLKAEAKTMLSEIDVDRIKWIRQVRNLSFADIKDVARFDKDGVEFFDSEDLDEAVSSAIESVEFHETATQFGGSKQIKVKMHSKTKGLEMLGKFLGLLVEKTEVEHTGEVNFTNLTPEDYQAKKAAWLAEHGLKEGGK